ncbi:unnamed protein product [Rangifer tarandus platyrhynchus]|uniref:Uncharacterized protein n=2 Tax=Rangifer tarandus platyrhynchus TaxID=3082113 RepID=A0AC59ZFP5_RANTA|nr:unnamed protein product [Rangifer tarandus platyrhynchus]
MGAAQGQQHVGCSVTKCEFFSLETGAKRPREHGFMVGAGIEKCGCRAGQPSFPRSTAMSDQTPAAAEMRRTSRWTDGTGHLRDGSRPSAPVFPSSLDPAVLGF